MTDDEPDRREAERIRRRDREVAATTKSTAAQNAGHRPVVATYRRRPWRRSLRP